MLCTVASMLTTTPRLRPLLAAIPKPASLSSPPGMTSATTAMTLLVPMSSPTTRSLYSLAICLPFFLSVFFVGGSRGDAPEPDRITVAVTQVGGLQVPPVARGHLRHRGDKAAR